MCCQDCWVVHVRCTTLSCLFLPLCYSNPSMSLWDLFGMCSHRHIDFTDTTCIPDKHNSSDAPPGRWRSRSPRRAEPSPTERRYHHSMPSPAERPRHHSEPSPAERRHHHSEPSPAEGRHSHSVSSPNERSCQPEHVVPAGRECRDHWSPSPSGRAGRFKHHSHFGSVAASPPAGQSSLWHGLLPGASAAPPRFDQSTSRGLAAILHFSVLSCCFVESRCP